MPDTAPAPALHRAWTASDPLVSVRGLKKWFPVSSGVLQRTIAHVHAVDGVDLDIKKGETLGLVGESGCGKSTLGRTLSRMLDANEGVISYRGDDITRSHGESLRRLRRKMTMIFQDPYASLDPRHTVGDIVGEPLDIHRLFSGRERTERIGELLNLQGLNAHHPGTHPPASSTG